MGSRLLPAAPALILLVAVLCASDHGERWSRHIGYLGRDHSDERLPDTESHRRAARYVAAELEKAGVLAAGGDGYMQTVKLRSRRILEPYSSLALVRDGAERPLALGGDAIVDMAFDPAPSVEAQLVLVGYGLSPFPNCTTTILRGSTCTARLPSSWLATSYFRRFTP